MNEKNKTEEKAVNGGEIYVGRHAILCGMGKNIFGIPRIPDGVRLYHCDMHGDIPLQKIKWIGVEPYCPTCNELLKVKSYHCDKHGDIPLQKIKWIGVEPYCPMCKNKNPLKVKYKTTEE